MGVRWECGTFGIFYLNKTAAPVCLGGSPWLCFQRHHLPVVIEEEDVQSGSGDLGSGSGSIAKGLAL